MANNCQIPTPTKYVRQMLNFIKYKDNLYEKRILENSCGEGNILLEVVQRYIKDARKQGKNDSQIVEGLENNIVAYEIDADKIRICVKRLNELIETFGLQGVNWNIYKKDFLKESWDTYDYIIGNPPYITYHDLKENERKYLQENFISCKEGRFDYSYAFIEASIKALNKNGKLVYILPYSVIKNKFAAKLRDFISPYVVGIYDYTGIKIFPNVLTSSVILLMENKKNRRTVQYHMMNSKQKRTLLRTQLSGKWNFAEEEGIRKEKFGDYFEVCNSVATLCNEAFLIENYQEKDNYYYVNEHAIEKQVVYPAISMKSYNKNKRNENSNTLILFPYLVDKGRVMHYSQNEFENTYPMAAKYLKTYKDELMNRKSDKSALWFEYGRSQAINRVFGEKLIIPMVITNNVSICCASTDSIPYAGYFIKCRSNSDMTLQQAKDILQSKEFYEYVKMCGTPTTPTSYRISVDDIKEYRF